MKCPYCNGEMESGYIQASRAVIFAKERHYIYFWPNKSVGEFLVTAKNHTAPTCTAYHCPECKKIICDYAVQ